MLIVLAEHLLKIKNELKKLRVTKTPRDSRYIHQKELHKVCFQHEIAYAGCKDLPIRATSDKILLDKAKHLILLKIQNMMDINMELLRFCISLLIKYLQVVLLHVYGQRP